MTDPTLKVLISAERIQARIRELGTQISADYPAGNLHMVCILKGACFFLTDLARAMERDVFVDFMGISTYGKGKTSSGEVKVTKDLDISLEDANVLIVEDIVDSGGLPDAPAGAAPPQIHPHRRPAGQAGTPPASRPRQLRGLPDSRSLRSGIRAGLRGKVSQS
ncbi:putative Hypoxanthine phosphoribosyltransferase [Candidatus Sulfopaludibacter sp. SbA3]|nr:putative Hypoxanthine phosphoribosyltransferase [Candidatus Sulfopaludibacter sp. SbA3]